MKINIRIILKKIPIVRRIYNSLAVRLLKLLNINNFLMSFMDIKFNLNINEPIDKSIILFNEYENKQINSVINLISKYQVSTFFDVGAHCGIYSLIIGKKFNNIEVHSFEPIKSSFLKLKKNISLNEEIQNIKTYNFGLSNLNTNLKMKAYKKNDYIQLGGFGVINRGDNLQNNFVSEATFKKGDDFFKFKNTTIFLKVDVEGHEINVLDGISKLIENNNTIIQVEILPGKYALVKKKLLEMNFKEIDKINFDYYFVKTI